MVLILFTEDTEPSHVEDGMKWTNRPTKLRAPEEAKPAKAADQPRKEEIVSLSYDQVNDNAEELIELRGEGRYFGVTDPETGNPAQQNLGPVCDNCHRRGHIRSKCKTVVCHKCGVVGDHYETQCPTTVVCVRCGERGHVVAACTSKVKKRQYCKSCDSFRHGNENCPGIWRSYLTIPENDGKLALPRIFCYNCASQQHYGDECLEQRTSRIPNINGSAFSGINLPKYLRDPYYDRLEKKTAHEPQRSGGHPPKPQHNSKLLHNTKFGAELYNKIKENNTNRDYKRQKKNGTSASPSPDLQPSRTGFISLKTQPKKGDIKPSRSGVISKKKKSRRDFN